MAYVQLVREHLHVCSAVMLFAELARQKSKAERVLLYPKVWDRVGDRSQEPMDRYGETSRRLLNMAADRYGVVLRPREPTPDEANGMLSGFRAVITFLTMCYTVRSSSTHSLAELLALTDYKRILHLQPSGLLLNSTELDRLLASSSKNLSRADPSTMTSKSNTSKQPLLITPSREAFDRAREDITAKPIPDTELLPHLIQEQDRILPSSTIHRSDNLVFESSSFHTQPPSFDAESFLTSTSYVHFSDPDLPGPEYYIPHDLFLRRPPGDSEARMVWQSMYERFRDLRMSVCGLDLEPMPREEVKPPDVRDAVSELSAHVR